MRFLSFLPKYDDFLERRADAYWARELDQANIALSELRSENGRLREDLEAEKVRNRVQQLEIETLAAVCARDLTRVQHETQVLKGRQGD